jgi:hypothetical protein
MGNNTADTCDHMDYLPGSACNSIPNSTDYAWFFMACNGFYDATVSTAGFSGFLENRTLSPLENDCDDGSTGVSYDTNGVPGAMWLIAHEPSAATCGIVTMQIAPI